jgi:NAD(P)H-hydrate epimerase
MATITRQELADLFVETGQAHHQAYIESDGVDPEWAVWYAPYLQAHLGDRLGQVLARADLVYLLVRAAREHAALDDPPPWPEFYAGLVLDDVAADSPTRTA